MTSVSEVAALLQEDFAEQKPIVTTVQCSVLPQVVSSRGRVPRLCKERKGKDPLATAEFCGSVVPVNHRDF